MVESSAFCSPPSGWGWWGRQAWLFGCCSWTLLGNQELQCMQGKLLLSFLVDLAHLRCRAGMGCCSHSQLQGVAGRVVHSWENVLGEWLCWRRVLRTAAANNFREWGTQLQRVGNPITTGLDSTVLYLGKAWMVLRLGLDDLGGLFQP